MSVNIQESKRQGTFATRYGGVEHILIIQLLGGAWTNPSEKYARQIGSFPLILEVNIKIRSNHHLDYTYQKRMQIVETNAYNVI